MAQPMVTAKLDMARFNRALKAMAFGSKKELPLFLYDQARRFCFEAIQQTKKSNAAGIDHLLAPRVIASQFIGKSGKRLKRAKKVRAPIETSFAARIINARRKKSRNKKNRGMLFGEKLETAARKMIAARKRSVGFAKSAWLPAIRKLSAALGQSGNQKSRGGGKQFGKDKGWANLVRGQWKPIAEVVNAAAADPGRFTWKDLRGLSKAIVEGARRALIARTRNMEEMLAKAMAKRLGKHATVRRI